MIYFTIQLININYTNLNIEEYYKKLLFIDFYLKNKIIFIIFEDKIEFIYIF